MTTTGDGRQLLGSIVFLGMFLCLSGCVSLFDPMAGENGRTIVVENQTQRPVTSVMFVTDQYGVELFAILPGGRREKVDPHLLGEHPRLEWRDEAGAWHTQVIELPAGFLPPKGAMKVEITEQGVRTGELVRGGKGK